MIHALERRVARGEVPATRVALRVGDPAVSPVRTTTYGELVDGARRVAGIVATAVPPGGTVLVGCSPGADFVAAFLGVLRAGRVPVPTYPPGSLDDSRNPAHLVEVARRSRAAACVADGSFTGEDGAGAAPQLDLRSAWDGPVPADPGATEPGTPAFVMFTSGTSRHRALGTVISRGALAANVRAITREYPGIGTGPAVTWLPPHHDMGLIGGLLTPLHLGTTVIALAPKDFVRRPLAWLEAISAHRAVFTAAPDFAYDLCVRRVTDAQVRDLVLDGWRHAVNGSEPVRRATMRAFAEHFAPAGFRPSAFRPSYGLAEATLLVSAGTWDPSSPDAEAVPCGPAAPGVSLRIVDPDTRRPVPDGAPGEVWVGGSAVADGYLDDPEADAQTFVAGPAPGERYVRTGDLGLLVDGQLHVVGRRVALLRRRGRDYSAEAAEAAAKDALPMVRACVATMAAGADGPRACLVCEVAAPPADDAVETIRHAVADRSGLWLDDVLFVAKGFLPKTSSGKVRRAECPALVDGLLVGAAGP